MRVNSSLLLLFATVFLGVNAFNPGSALVRRQNSDKEVIAHFSTIGLCFSYFNGGNRDKSLAPCKVWCEKQKQGPSSYGCRGPSVPREKLDPSLIYEDEDGNQWTAGECECNSEIVEALVDIVVEALSKLGNILCAIMLSMLEMVVEVGVDLIPGGQAVAAARIAVQGAKSFVENGMTAASFFGDWIGKVCGVSNWNFDLTTVFMGLVNAPDSMGTSIGCFKKNKKNCRKPDSKPDPKPTFKPDPKPTNKPDPKPTDKPTDKPTTKPTNKPTNKPTTKPTDKPATITRLATTKTHKSAATSDNALACKLDKRAGPGPREGKLGEDERREECNKEKTVHVTKTSKAIGWYTTEIPKKCPKQHSQACYHYRSVMSVFTNNADMVRWTCQATKGTSVDGKATSSWGVTAITTLQNKQHWWPWANGFVPRTLMTHTGGKIVTKGCERDEWPPRAFWPGDEEAEKKEMVQRVRFIQHYENGGAGQIWNNFCNQNAAQSIRGKKTYIKSEFIKTMGNPQVKKDVGKDKITTIISSVSVDTARAIFTIKDWDGLPDDKEWHGLKRNPCWPSLLAPEDPGWALLTNDEFYTVQHPELAKYTARYREYPNLAVLKGALRGGNLKPPYSYSIIDAAGYKRKLGVNGIPRDYLGVLPGIPFPKLSRRSAAFRLNATDPSENIADNLEWDSPDDEIDSYDDEELDRWIEKYMELVRRQHAEESSRTVPPQTEAQPTPAGQGDPTAVPAIEGRLAIAGLPEATQASI